MKTTQSCIDFDVLKEDQIEMSAFIKNYDKVKEERRKFAESVRYYDGTDLRPLDVSPMPIPIRCILELFKMLPGNPCDVRIRGVKMIFGLEADKITLFFRPVTMSRSTDPLPPFDMDYEIDESYQAHACVGGTLKPVSEEDLQASKGRYAAQIWIKRRKHSKFYALNQSSSGWYRDTKEVIFSFQEIFKLYYGDEGCKENDPYDTTLYIYNGVANYRNSFMNRWRRKHNLFIALEEIDKVKRVKVKVISSINRAANLAHLCPPSCAPGYSITKTYPCP